MATAPIAFAEPFVGRLMAQEAVFDALDLPRGPLALAHLSHRVPAGFHGNWRPGTL